MKKMRLKIINLILKKEVVLVINKMDIDKKELTPNWLLK